MIIDNIKRSRHCAFCKYWFDSTCSTITPKNPKGNLWAFDEKARKKCLKNNVDTPAGSLCRDYFRYGATLSVPNDELLKLSQIYRNRANILGLNVDDKFRNLSGMKIQLGCIHYVVTGGKEGMSGASSLFYKTYDLYKHNPCEFQNICKSFYEKYH